MPLILPPEAVETWLSGTPEEAKKLLVAYPSELMRAHPVAKRINTPRNDDPDQIAVIEPIPADLFAI
jgi:putative SOS response-associated peptidase YedK